MADISPVAYPNKHHDATLDGLDAIQKIANTTGINSRSQADQILEAYVPEKSVRGFLLKNLVRQADGCYGLRLNLEAINDQYNILGDAPTGEVYNGPTLFIKGNDSAYIQTKHRTAIDTLFPCAELAIIKDTGHWLHAEKPAQFNQLVHTFLSS